MARLPLDLEAAIMTPTATSVSFVVSSHNMALWTGERIPDQFRLPHS